MTVPRFGHWVAGCATPPAGGEYLASNSPAHGGLVAEVPHGTGSDAVGAVRAASVAQPGWAALSTAQRSRALLDLASRMRECFDELVELEAAETGKIVAALRSEISGSIEFFEYYAAVVRGLRGQSLEPTAGSFAFVRREPYGVVAVVTPWNGPLNQACREAAPANIANQLAKANHPGVSRPRRVRHRAHASGHGPACARDGHQRRTDINDCQPDRSGGLPWRGAARGI